MGFTGELVRSVFFTRNRSTDHHETKVRSNKNGVKKRRWVSVKSYLCGDDDHNSVVADEDPASVKNSEEGDSSGCREETKSDEETVDNNNVTEIDDDRKKNSNSKSLNEEEAAILIQSAYRAFLRRRQNEGIGKKANEEEELSLVMGSPEGKSSMGSSIEVQTGNSIEVCPLDVQKQSVVHHHPTLHRSRSQVLKQRGNYDIDFNGNYLHHIFEGFLKILNVQHKMGNIEINSTCINENPVKLHNDMLMKLDIIFDMEDWDDSTASSSVSKMRMQNRIEATTRRERALAYAFSLQLRICSNRKSSNYDSSSNNAEPNMSWSWLERWMATRLPDTDASVESHGFAVMRKRFVDVGREEKESCGSNEVPLQFDNYSTTSQEVKDHEFIPPQTKAKNNLKGRRRTVSRRKTVPSYQFPVEHFKVSKRDGSSGVRKDSRQFRSRRTEMKSNSPSRT